MEQNLHYVLSSFSIFLFSLLFFMFFLRTIEAAIIIPKNATIPAIFTFGDSFADHGNNNHIKTIAKANFLPYGKDFMGGKPTGRFSNGKTLADLIAQEFGIKEFVPAYLDPKLQQMDLLTGVSFGSAASGFDPQTPKLSSAMSTSDQLELFKEYIGKLKGIVGEDGSNNILSNSIYLVVAGTGDLANTYFTVRERKLQYNIDSYTDFLVQLASEFVKELYEVGARRILVFGVSPIGCLPSQRTLEGGISRNCANNENQAAQLYNFKLSNALDSINNSFNDAKTKIVYVDFYTPVFNLIQNKDRYGFVVADRGCCGTGTIETTVLCNPLSKTCEDDSTYLFWDSFHPTEQGNKVLVYQILQTSLSNFF